VQKALKHYEGQTEDEVVAGNEAALGDQTQTIMEVPTALVLLIRALIVKHQA
jgi:hypothetical protein